MEQKQIACVQKTEYVVNVILNTMRIIEAELAQFKLAYAKLLFFLATFFKNAG